MYIGTEPTQKGTLKGIVDDLRIYNRALSDSDVKELYNLKDSGTCDTTSAYNSGYSAGLSAGKSSGGTTTSGSSNSIEVVEGWNLKGAAADIGNTANFFTDSSCIDTVWAYKNSAWQKLQVVALPNPPLDNIGSFKKNDGFWIKAKKSCTISDSSGGTSSNPPSMPN